MTAGRPANHEQYQFGDTDLAAERLQLLAEVFAPSTREFLASLSGCEPRTIIDLGCGPGFTTRLLAEMFPHAHVLGVDSSARFVELAQAEPLTRARYIVADVREPLPAEGYDLAYCRYLLTHVADFRRAIDQWSGALRGGGLIAIEENDWIRSEQPAFSNYLEIVARMLAAQGQRLYIGSELAESSHWSGLTVVSSQLVDIATTDRDAARMFLMNLRGWRTGPFVTQHYAAAEINRLQGALEELAQGDPATSSIVFGRRRLVLQKPLA
jgi:trans-aconitate 2-methyltransferase